MYKCSPFRYTQFWRCRTDNPIIIVFGTKDGNHHSQDDRTLDDGEPIIRKYTPVKEKSYLLLMLEFIEKGTEMLSVLHRNNWIYKECEPLKLKYPYRSWPTLEELKDFSKSHSYVKYKDIFNLHG